jgi:hypothetical protein
MMGNVPANVAYHQGRTKFMEIMLDDEVEPKMGRGELVLAGVCVFLSLLCGFVWLLTLIMPNLLRDLF